MALFQTSVLKKYLTQQDRTAVEKAYRTYSNYFLNLEIQENIRTCNEEQFQATFLTEFFVNVLDYTINPSPKYNLTTEYKNEKNNRKTDGAILNDGATVAVVELKGTNTKDLESIRKQAFDYKVNHKGCRFVITSNFEKLRLYIDDATEHLAFDLFQLTEANFSLLYLCLHKDNLLKAIPLKIKQDSLIVEEQITKDFYKDYSLFKRELYRDLVKKNGKVLKVALQNDTGIPDDENHQNDLERLEKNVKLTLFKKSQKLIDRFLFIFFAEDRGLLQPNYTLKRLAEWDTIRKLDVDEPLYDRFKKHFNYLNKGRKGDAENKEIFAYNGGLFKPDSILDRVLIDDELLYKHTKKLATYDFESQVDVNILGHIFENSLNEIESINAEIEGGDFDKQKSKRKKDGVFYTPKYITKYIVENTVGKLCDDKKAALGFQEEEYFKGRGTGRNKRNDKTIQKLVTILDDYREWLLQITICDPACGSGAFLNQALDFLIKEHQYIDELKTKILGGGLQFPDIENTILENNIYGVDLNEESVEIAKLSLWLRTAQPRRKLNDLSSNIKCGNSLIDSKSVVGDKAFHWETAFAKVFENGGFDVVIGNPPYVARSLDDNVKKYINKIYKTAQYQVELYVSFIEKGTELLKQNGNIGFIVPNSWLKNLRMSDCREYVLENLDISILSPNLDNVFPDASVDTLIFIGGRNKDLGKMDIIEFVDSQPTLKHQINQTRFLKNDGLIFDVEISEDILPIINKVRTNILAVGDIMDVIRGVNPYDKYTGQSQEIIKSRAYHSNTQLDETFVPELKGKHVSPYNYSWDNEHYISYGEWLAAPRPIKYFSGERIVFREILGKTLVSTLIKEPFIIDRSLYIARIDDKIENDFIIEYILSVLNSRLMSFYFRYSNNEFDTLFPKIRVAEFKKLPIKIVGIDDQRKSKIKVDALLESKKAITNLISKFNRYYSQKFSLIKTSRKLENWQDLDFGDFIKELNKAIKATNKQRDKDGLASIATLTKTDEFEWLDLFEQNKKIAQDLQLQINTIEQQIDAMVYEMYGLSEDEIKIVEGS